MARESRCWDLFCRVIDNYGDVGVCWRLAADLAARGAHVRLWIDDPEPLRWMAPGGTPGVQLVPWIAPLADRVPGDVVVEAFGCDPPPGYVARMAACTPRPVWVNLEYLSAEPFVQRSHGLRSPQPGGLDKWFFYPGFTPGTGGLLRELGLVAEQATFDQRAWLAGQGIEVRAGERRASLFCYDNPALPSLLAALADQPTVILATPGHAQRQVRTLALPACVRVVELPWLAQADYDRLLWSCDLNFVRGEDSLVRALWAGAPLVWQIYPQHDGAHAAKLEALLALLCAGADPSVGAKLAQVWRVWNGLLPGALQLPALPAWASASARFRARLMGQPDLATQLIGFVAGKG